jgi:hypothetical protein
MHNLSHHRVMMVTQTDLVERLGDWSPIPVTYAGGARSIADLELVTELGKGKVRVGGLVEWPWEGWQNAEHSLAAVYLSPCAAGVHGENFG